MKNSTKGMLAGGAMVVLLMGGAGSLAYWTDAQNLPASQVTSGHLKLETDAAVPSAWKLNGNAVADITAVRIVPGDTVTFTGGYKLRAVGNSLKGTLSFAGGAASGTLAPKVTVASAFTLNGAAVPAGGITSANDGQTVGAELTIAFPFGTEDNSSNVKGGLVLNLSAINVTVTQTA